MSTDYVVVYCTVPSQEKGLEVGRAVVEERLAACANVVPGLRSIYWWQGKVCDEPEALVILKTTGALFGRLADRIAALHPYDTPEIVAAPLVRGNERYLAWIDDSVGGR